MGGHITKYDSLVTLTHFKGHTMGGFGGSNKNLGIGIADGRIGKKMIHSGETGSQWGVTKDEFMERMVESTKATVDHFGKHITFINVLRNMSVDCDCCRPAFLCCEGTFYSVYCLLVKTFSYLDCDRSVGNLHESPNDFFN